MPNEFQFSFSTKDIEKLIAAGGERLIVTGKVVHNPDNGSSTFEIYAESNGKRGETRSAQSEMKIIGCPMPC